MSPCTARPSAVVQSATDVADAAAPHEGVEAVDHLGEAADEVEVAVADVVERERAADEPVVLAGHRRAQQDAVQAR